MVSVYVRVSVCLRDGLWCWCPSSNEPRNQIVDVFPSSQYHAENFRIPPRISAGGIAVVVEFADGRRRW